MPTNYTDDMQFPPTETLTKIYFTKNEIEYIYNKIQPEPDFADIPNALVYLQLKNHQITLVPNSFHDLILIACNEVFNKEYDGESIPIETTVPILRGLLDITKDPSREQLSTIQKSIRSKIVGAIFVKTPNAESLKMHQQRGEELLKENDIKFDQEKNNGT